MAYALGTFLGLMIGDCACWFISREQRYKHARYLLPIIGGYMAVWDKIGAAPLLEAPQQCNNCKDVFEPSIPPEHNGDVLIIGARRNDDFLIAAETAENFKTWNGRNLISKDGLSAAMKEEIERRDGTPYCETFCHSDNGRLVMLIRHAP
jgi:hypothetical protein